MALRQPPRHRADAAIEFVHPRDEAWDHDRIKAEQAEMAKAGQDPKDHAWALYIGGMTRYDLDAEHDGRRPSDYLDSARATTWTLKRLPSPLYYKVRSAAERAARAGEAPYDAYLLALTYGIGEVKGEGAPKLEGLPGSLTIADIDTLHDIDDDLPLDLGLAVYQASMPLTAGESVPSDSGRGPGGSPSTASSGGS